MLEGKVKISVQVNDQSLVKGCLNVTWLHVGREKYLKKLKSGNINRENKIITLTVSYLEEKCTVYFSRTFDFMYM